MRIRRGHTTLTVILSKEVAEAKETRRAQAMNEAETRAKIQKWGDPRPGLPTSTHPNDTLYPKRNP